LLNISSKAFASKNKDGAGQSDKEVDKSKKTVKASTSAVPQEEHVSEAPKQVNTPKVRVIESIPNDKVKNC